jgi:isoleucyl-tRNA synthetase
MKAVAEAITNMSQDALNKFEETGTATFEIQNLTFEIALADVEIIAEDVPGWQVANLGKLTVALDVNITNELKQEGIARNFINRVQNLRKEKGFEVTDKINVRYRTDSLLISEAVQNNLSYICAEILADAVNPDSQLSEGDTVLIDDNEVLIFITRI